VETLLGDPSKAHEKLGWTPTTTLEDLVAEMVAADREEARKEAILRLKGFNVVGSMENPPTNPYCCGRRWRQGLMALPEKPAGEHLKRWIHCHQGEHGQLSLGG
jgi:hypothetical protein